MSLTIFFLLAAVAVFAAVMVIMVKNPVSSALYLVLVMCCLAGLFVLLGALFLAAMQVIVYAGAIMVLFLFVIMLLNLRKDEFGRDSHIIQKYLGMALVAAILVQGVLIVSWAMKDYSASMQVVAPSGISPVPGDSLPAPIDYNSAHSVATTLFAKYAFPFEVTSILLLAAMIGAVVIARRRKLSDTESEES